MWCRRCISKIGCHNLVNLVDIIFLTVWKTVSASALSWKPCNATEQKVTWFGVYSVPVVKIHWKQVFNQGLLNILTLLVWFFHVLIVSPTESAAMSHNYRFHKGSSWDAQIMSQVSTAGWHLDGGTTEVIFEGHEEKWSKLITSHLK